MSSKKEFVEFIVDQLADAGDIRYRQMFGEYGVYCNDKFFACICDNQLFIKITDEGKEIIENPETASPYQGAKPYFLITDIDDKERLCQLAIATCEVLPEPKPKKKKRK